MQNLRIVVRGGGDLATGVIHRLWRAGFTPLVLECTKPAAIRRQVALCEAVYAGMATVEGMTGVLIRSLSDAVDVWQAGQVPVLVDETAACVQVLLSEQGSRKAVGDRDFYIALNKCDTVAAAVAWHVRELLAARGLALDRIWLRSWQRKF